MPPWNQGLPQRLSLSIAQRRSDLSALVQHLATTTEALANQRTALGTSIQRLPGFMAQANTTFVNLRNALDDVKPLVDASKPVAPKLQKLLEQLKPLAEDSVPTVRDLANIVRRPGANNSAERLQRRTHTRSVEGCCRFRARHKCGDHYFFRYQRRHSRCKRRVDAGSGARIPFVHQKNRRKDCRRRVHE